jgi:4-methyl-5(b-hydroxyethyl)-thiazole monophosphate biosynthesis
MKTSSALVIIFDGVEELEAVAPIDCLRRADIHVTVASASESLTTKGRNQITLTADASLEDAILVDYDLVVIPGGPGHAALIQDPRIKSLLLTQNEAGRLIASICAGPVVLKEAGLLEGKAFTSFPGTSGELPDRIPDRSVVRDGNIITSQGAGTALPFALELVEALCGKSTRRAISESICAIQN